MDDVRCVQLLEAIWNWGSSWDIDHFPSNFQVFTFSILFYLWLQGWYSQILGTSRDLWHVLGPSVIQVFFFKCGQRPRLGSNPCVCKFDSTAQNEMSKQDQSFTAFFSLVFWLKSMFLFYSQYRVATHLKSSSHLVETMNSSGTLPKFPNGSACPSMWWLAVNCCLLVYVQHIEIHQVGVYVYIYNIYIYIYIYNM